MESKNQMPKVNRGYPESDVSDNQRLRQDPEKKDQKNNRDEKMKGTGADIENLPEIIPARTGILG